MTLPPMPPSPWLGNCRWHGQQLVPRVAFSWTEGVPLPALRICPHCDMGANAPHAGPPVMLDYLRKGHQ